MGGNLLAVLRFYLYHTKEMFSVGRHREGGLCATPPHGLPGPSRFDSLVMTGPSRFGSSVVPGYSRFDSSCSSVKSLKA